MAGQWYHLGRNKSCPVLLLTWHHTLQKNFQIMGGPTRSTRTGILFFLVDAFYDWLRWSEGRRRITKEKKAFKWVQWWVFFTMTMCWNEFIALAGRLPRKRQERDTHVNLDFIFLLYYYRNSFTWSKWESSWMTFDSQPSHSLVATKAVESTGHTYLSIATPFSALSWRTLVLQDSIFTQRCCGNNVFLFYTETLDMFEN